MIGAGRLVAGVLLVAYLVAAANIPYENPTPIGRCVCGVLKQCLLIDGGTYRADRPSSDLVLHNEARDENGARKAIGWPETYAMLLRHQSSTACLNSSVLLEAVILFLALALISRGIIGIYLRGEK
jgi:hypothetical protein